MLKHTNESNPPLTPNNTQNQNPVSAVSLLALADLTWDFSGQVFTPAGKWKLTPFAERFYQTVSHTPPSLTMLETACPKSKPCPMAELPKSSSAVFPVKMCQWQANEQDLMANAQAYSLTLLRLSKQSSQDLSCLKMSQVSSIPTMAKTYKQSLKRLPNAGMWDFGECLTAVISESPKNAVEYSWSQVLENTRHLALWLTWGQWNAFLARLNRNRAGRTHTIRYWQGSAHPPSTSIVPISSLYQTDGVRWLSGSERLSMMGFAKDWMRPTLLRLGLREMPLSPQVAQFIASHLMTAFNP